MYLPLLALVALTFVVLTVMFLARVSTMRKNRIHIEKLADNSRFDDLLIDASNPADNFINLFEMPVLFYVAALIIELTGRTDPFYVGFAWAYVAFRVLHSFIHCTYNRVMHRFVTYFASCAVLLAVWVRLASQLVLAP